MVVAIIIGLIALAFTASFLNAFFQLNRSEVALKEALQDVEASMVNYYGRPTDEDEKPTKDAKSKEKKEVKK